MHEDAQEAAAATARDIARILRDAVVARGTAHLAVSGGSTAPPMLAVLAGEDVPWHAIHLYQIDERVAPDGDEDRNATDLMNSLVRAIDIPPGNVHLMPVTAPDLDEAAASYGAGLPRLDVAHMGMGDDGHTASWPPGHAVLGECDQPVTVLGPFNGHLRMTITPGVAEDARAVVFLVPGASKREMLARMLGGDPTVPASHVPMHRTTVHVDRAAVNPA